MVFSIHTPIGTGRYCHPVTTYNSFVPAHRVHASYPCRPCLPRPYYPSTHSTYYPSYSYSSYNPCHYRATPVYPYGCHQTAASTALKAVAATALFCALL